MRDRPQAASSLPVAAACHQTSAPTDKPGGVSQANPPKDASVAVESGSNATATAGTRLAVVATRSTTGAPTNAVGVVPLENQPPAVDVTPFPGSCASVCGNKHLGTFVLAAILWQQLWLLPTFTRPRAQGLGQRPVVGSQVGWWVLLLVVKLQPVLQLVLTAAQQRAGAIPTVQGHLSRRSVCVGTLFHATARMQSCSQRTHGCSG